MFSKFGAFHLGTGHEEPVEALERKLDDPRTTNALIVLPEAFNLGRPYYTGDSAMGMPKFERDVVIGQLKAISLRSAIAFVVGLLEPKTEDSRKPHSSAYFISAKQVCLMCHKQLCDNSGHYSICRENPDRNNPIFQEDASVIAAICRDVDEFNRFERVAKSAKQEHIKQNVVCIPAAMRSTSFWWRNFGEQPEFPQT